MRAAADTNVILYAEGLATFKGANVPARCFTE